MINLNELKSGSIFYIVEKYPKLEIRKCKVISIKKDIELNEELFMIDFLSKILHESAWEYSSMQINQGLAFNLFWKLEDTLEYACEGRV